MATYDWICRECNIWWEREYDVGKAPDRTKCPKCRTLSHRYWQNQGVAVKFGDDMDFHTVRARHKKVQAQGFDKTAGDRWLRTSIEGTTRAMNDETQRYSQMDIDWDKLAKSRGLEKVGERETRNKMERSRKLTAEAYDIANKQGYRDIGSEKLDIAKPEKNNPVK